MSRSSPTRRGGPGRLRSVLGSVAVHAVLLGIGAALGLESARALAADPGRVARLVPVRPPRPAPAEPAEEPPLAQAASEPLAEPEPRAEALEPAPFPAVPRPRELARDDLAPLLLPPESLALVPPPAAAEPEPAEVAAAEPEPPAAPESAPESERAGASAPVLLEAPAPVYPRLSVRLGEEGVVACVLHVEADGRVACVELEASSGHPRLDQAALERLSTWRFRPATRAGEPVASTYRHRVRFELD